MKQHKGKELVEYIDPEKHFTFRPYTFTPRGIAEGKLYAALSSDIVKISSDEVQMEIWRG